MSLLETYELVISKLQKHETQKKKPQRRAKLQDANQTYSSSSSSSYFFLLLLLLLLLPSSLLAHCSSHENYYYCYYLSCFAKLASNGPIHHPSLIMLLQKLFSFFLSFWLCVCSCCSQVSSSMIDESSDKFMQKL